MVAIFATLTAHLAFLRLPSNWERWVARPESSKGVGLRRHALRRLRACHPETGIFEPCPFSIELGASFVTYSDLLAKLLIRTGIARFLPTVQRLTDGGGAFLHYYSDQVLAAPLAELREFAAFRGLHGPDAIDLALGAPRFDLVSSGSTKLPADRRGWPPPWGLPELREAVAEKLLADHRLAVSPTDEVLITHGAAGAFSLALDTFVNRGDRVVLFDPTSPLYVLSLRHRRARIRWLSTWMDRGRLRFRLAAF